MQDEFQTKELFLYLCLQPDQARSIAALDERSLRDLTAWLTLRDVETGIPGLIRGLCICEACDRFMKRPPLEQGGPE